MGRIQKKFAELKKKRRKALVVFMTAGDPSLGLNEKLIPAFEKEGADLIELGVPFSDPLADGPTIQASSQRSLKRGTNLKKILRMVSNARKHSQIPIVLMSYLNPIGHYGLGRFASDARRAGVDGIIVPDLPPDEGKEVGAAMKRGKLDLVYLLAPTSSSARLKSVTRASSGFVYYVSLTGVTGVRRGLPSGLSGQLRAVRKASRLPVCVGFGISTPQQAKQAASFSDGVIIGSVIVRALHDGRKASAQKLAQKILRPFAAALGKGK